MSTDFMLRHPHKSRCLILIQPIGWHAADIRKHHGYPDIHDFHLNWLALDIALGAEAKAKVLTALKLRQELGTL
jgi:hypothetical protein